MSNRRWTARLLLAGAAGGLAGHALAAERPLWELGLGVGGLRLPHYRGSDQSHQLLLPVPYVVYRGAILRADRSGARAVLYETSSVNFDVSVAASPPTRSDDDDARRGMSDLKPTVEVGPNLNWTMTRGAGWKLDLRLPVRAALTVESHPRTIGWVASPNLNLDLANMGSWKLGLLAGPEFATRRYNGYFYDVPADDASASRPQYRAPGGYAGARVAGALSRRFDGGWMGLFVRYDSLHGARFDDSPLVQTRSNVSFGFAVAWVLATSSRQVSTED